MQAPDHSLAGTYGDRLQHELHPWLFKSRQCGYICYLEADKSSAMTKQASRRDSLKCRPSHIVKRTCVKEIVLILQA